MPLPDLSSFLSIVQIVSNQTSLETFIVLGGHLTSSNISPHFEMAKFQHVQKMKPNLHELFSCLFVDAINAAQEIPQFFLLFFQNF